MGIRNAISVILIVTGNILLMTQVFGYIFPGDYRGQNIGSYNSAISRLDQAYLKNGSSSHFLKKAVEIYNLTIWKNRSGNQKVTFSENWVLWLLSYIDNPFVNIRMLDQDEFFAHYYVTYSYKKTLKRADWDCRHFSIGFTDLLVRRYNISTFIVNLGEHTITEAVFDDGAKYLMDPMVGIVFNFGLDEVEYNLPEIKASYQNYEGFAHFADAYNEDNFINFTEEKPGACSYVSKYCIIEKTSDVLRLIIPLLLIIIGIVILIKNKDENNI